MQVMRACVLVFVGIYEEIERDDLMRFVSFVFLGICGDFTLLCPNYQHFAYMFCRSLLLALPSRKDGTLVTITRSHLV